MISLINYANAIVTFSLLLTGLIVLFKGQNSDSKWTSILFVVSVILYVVIDNVPDGIIHHILLVGPFLVPFSFWLVSKSLFSDEAISSKIGIYAILVLSSYYVLYFLNEYNTYGLSALSSVLSRVISVFFVFLALIEAQRGKHADLIEKRRRIRSVFTYAVGALVLITLLAELGLTSDDQQVPKLLQRGSIIIFNAYFIIANVEWKNNFLGTHQKKHEITNPELVDKILEIVFQEKHYRKESLTIRQLAELLEEQEYKVRQTINQQLGYRNFTEFINSFRIGEAKEVFSDQSQKDITILEVAYKVGFNSIGPFNRAFKASTGQTPTEFRRNY